MFLSCVINDVLRLGCSFLTGSMRAEELKLMNSFYGPRCLMITGAVEEGVLLLSSSPAHNWISRSSKGRVGFVAKSVSADLWRVALYFVWLWRPRPQARSMHVKILPGCE